MSYQIGDFEFISLSRVFPRPTQKLVREKRPGLHGVTLWRTGRTGEPFQITSAADCASLEAAEALLHLYELLVGADPVVVRWGNLDLPDILAVVHDVQAPEGGIFRTVLGIGGLLGTSQAFCRAIWTVETIDPLTMIT